VVCNRQFSQRAQPLQPLQPLQRPQWCPPAMPGGHAEARPPAVRADDHPTMCCSKAAPASCATAGQWGPRTLGACGRSEVAAPNSRGHDPSPVLATRAPGAYRDGRSEPTAVRLGTGLSLPAAGPDDLGRDIRLAMWRGARPEQGERRGPTRDGAGSRRRLRRAEPGRATGM
jgi:hypothetical protein